MDFRVVLAFAFDDGIGLDAGLIPGLAVLCLPLRGGHQQTGPVLELIERRFGAEAVACLTEDGRLLAPDPLGQSLGRARGGPVDEHGQRARPGLALTIRGERFRDAALGVTQV